MNTCSPFRPLKEKTFEDTGVTIKLSVVPPGGTTQCDAPQSANYVILFDCADVQLELTDAVVLRVSNSGKDWV